MWLIIKLKQFSSLTVTKIFVTWNYCSVDLCYIKISVVYSSCTPPKFFQLCENTCGLEWFSFWGPNLGEATMIGAKSLHVLLAVVKVAVKKANLSYISKCPIVCHIFCFEFFIWYSAESMSKKKKKIHRHISSREIGGH